MSTPPDARPVPQTRIRHNTCLQLLHKMSLSNEQTCASVARCSLPAGERHRDTHTTQTDVEDTGIVSASATSTNPTHDQSRNACTASVLFNICELREGQRKFQGNTLDKICPIEAKYAQKVCQDLDHVCRPTSEALYSTRTLDPDPKMSHQDNNMEPG